MLEMLLGRALLQMVEERQRVDSGISALVTQLEDLARQETVDTMELRARTEADELLLLEQGVKLGQVRDRLQLLEERAARFGSAGEGSSRQGEEIGTLRGEMEKLRRDLGQALNQQEAVLSRLSRLERYEDERRRAEVAEERRRRDREEREREEYERRRKGGDRPRR